MMTSSNGNISALLIICAWNSSVTNEFHTQRPVTRCFDVFFDLRLDKQLSKQSWGWCFETPSCPWASYQIRKIAGCACAGNAGNVFPRRRFQRKPIVGDPGMHHGTCVTHVPWCMSGSLTCGDGENVPGIPGACAPAILRIWQEAHYDVTNVKSDTIKGV